MSITLTRTRKNNICDFSCKFDFGGSTSTTYGRLPPMIRGHHFLSLEKDTNFFADFEQKLKREPCNLGEDWENRGYAVLFSILGESKTKDYCAWGTGHGKSYFCAMAEGTLGKPAGQAETLPLCILLDYRDAPPPSLILSVSARIGVEQTSYKPPKKLTRFSLGKRLPRYSNRELPPIEIACGPSLPLLAEDKIGARPSRFPTLLGSGPRVSTPVTFPSDLVNAGKPARRHVSFDMPDGNSAVPDLSRKSHTEEELTQSNAVSPKEGSGSSLLVSPARPSSLLEPMYEVKPVQGPPLFGLQGHAGRSDLACSPWQESEPFEPSSGQHDGRAPREWPYFDPAKVIAAFFANLNPWEKAAYERASDPIEHIMVELNRRWGADLLECCRSTWDDIRSIVEQQVRRDAYDFFFGISGSVLLREFTERKAERTVLASEWEKKSAKAQQRDPRWHDPVVVDPSTTSESGPDEPVQDGNAERGAAKGRKTSSVGSDETLVGDGGPARAAREHVNTAHARPSQAGPPLAASVLRSGVGNANTDTRMRRERALRFIATRHGKLKDDVRQLFRIFHNKPSIGINLLRKAYEVEHGPIWEPQIPAEEGFSWLDVEAAMEEVFDVGQYRRVHAPNEEEARAMRAEGLLIEVLEELEAANQGNVKRAIFEVEPIKGLDTLQKVAKELYGRKWLYEVPEAVGFKYSDILHRLEIGDLYRYGPKTIVESLSLSQRNIELHDIPYQPDTQSHGKATSDDHEVRPSTPASVLPSAHVQQSKALSTDQDSSGGSTEPYSPTPTLVTSPAPRSPVTVAEPQGPIEDPQASEESILQGRPPVAPALYAPGTPHLPPDWAANASAQSQAEAQPQRMWNDFIYDGSPLEAPQELDERLPGIDL